MNVLKPFILLCIFVTTSFAQDVNFSATADKTNATIGEQITITAQLVCGKKPGSISAPQLRSTGDFDVLGSNQNQSSSTSIEVVNGKMTQNVTMTYLFYFTIAPKKAGSFTVPALQVGVDGNTYTSNPFTVNVGKEQVQATTEVRVSLLVNKHSLCVGEQSVLTVQVAQKAGSSVQLTQQGLAQLYDRVEKACGKDFSVVRLFSQLPSKGVNQVINGENWFVVNVNYALFPLNAGLINVSPVAFEYIPLKRTQSRRRMDPFEDFFGGGFFGGGVEQVARTVVSNALNVHITQLPPAPADFLGAVGNFRLTAAIDPKQVPSGEAATLSISISGNTRPGNIGDITLPQLTDCSVFAPEKHVAVDTTANGISTQKTYKYLIVPRQEGLVHVPQISWSYFDPAAKAFKTLSSPKLDLMVTPGKAAPALQSRYLTQEEIKQVGQDIRYIKTGIKIKKQTEEPYKNPLFIFLYLLPFCIALFSLLYKIQSTRYEKDATLALRQKAVRSAMRKISAIEKQASKLSVPDFLGKVSECLESFISHKFGFSATGKVLVDLKAELIEHGTGEQLAGELVSFLENMETYRFGGAQLDGSSKTIMLQKTRGFIKELQKVKKEKR
jgi:hypothetical protein